MADPRRTFGPSVVVGIAGAGLAAVAGHETWVVGKSCPDFSGLAAGTAEAPGATAVALALLAAWGVLLVTRGKVRRVASVLVALLALGLVVAVVLGAGAAESGLRDRLRDVGASCGDLHRTGWFWLAVAALPFAVLPALAAVGLVPSWPEMGRKYDAPADAAPEADPQTPEEQENLDLWKAMDEGRDPTA